MFREADEQPLTDTLSGSTALACDDTEGKPHHPGGINVVFVDTHAVFQQDLSPDEGVAGSVGRDWPVDKLKN